MVYIPSCNSRQLTGSYQPSLLQELKHGWVQYVALLLPMLVAARMLQEFLFRSRTVVAALVMDESVRKAHRS